MTVNLLGPGPTTSIKPPSQNPFKPHKTTEKTKINYDNIISDPKEIRKAIRELIASDCSAEKMRIETPEVTIYKGIDCDGNAQYRLYTNGIVGVFGNDAYLDENGNLNITSNGKRVGFYIIKAPSENPENPFIAL